MSNRTRIVLAGAGATLLLGAAAQAGLTGIVTERREVLHTPLDLYVCSVSLQFDHPLDVGYAVAGTPGSPLDISIDGSGSFYEHPFGTVRPPVASWLYLAPSLHYDTFVTFNTQSNADGDPPSLSPGFPVGWSALSDGLAGTNLGWFVTPDDPLAIPDAAGRVLIAQLTVDRAAQPAAAGISGTVLVQWDDPNGVTFQSYVSFQHAIPVPGALAAFVAAALVGTRRRRRT